MLCSLSIRNILIIRRIDIEFDSGLNVFTGETGAGKSILLDALGFALGFRGRGDLLGQGAEKGEVTAGFHVPVSHRANRLLRDAGIAESSELVLRRSVFASRRRSSYANDTRCTGGVLRSVAESLLEIHGQASDRGLLNRGSHRMLLDSFGGHGNDLRKTRQAWRDWQSAKSKLARQEAAVEDSERETAFAELALKELDELAPKEGEESRLDAKRRLMRSSQRILEDLFRASEAIGPNGAEGMAGEALRWVEQAGASSEIELDNIMQAIDRALAEIDEASRGLEAAKSDLEFHPYEFEQLEERLFEVRRLARKHRVAPDELAGLADTFKATLDRLQHNQVELDRLRIEVECKESAYNTLASNLSRLRQQAGVALDSRIQGELGPLRLHHSTFRTHLEVGEPGQDGQDAVAFKVATNRGNPLGNIGEIASGGELSRFMLALRVCLTSGESVQTMVFDEIDSGVGGATADAVGSRLRRLARNAQILVVTHSPQVAAYGQRHWRVEKTVEGGQTSAGLSLLEGGGRRDEIARMLSGNVITDEARAAADVLLASAEKKAVK